MSEHVLPIKTYVLVFVSLLVLLVLTVAAAEIEHEVLNMVVALTIATTKAVLIVLFFMHVRYNTFVIRLAVVAGFFWLAILLTFTLSDYMTRDRQAEIGSTQSQHHRKSRIPIRTGTLRNCDEQVGKAHLIGSHC